MELDLASLCSSVSQLARETGTFIREEGKKMDASRIQQKGTNDFVTEVDKASEQRLVAALSTLLPEAGFIAEEGTSTKKGEHYNWVIDPIDGTTNFIHQIPCFSISIGLQAGAELVLGVVYEVNQDECFYAWKNGGAWLNGQRIAVSTTPKLADALLATGFPYQSLGKQDEYLLVFKDLLNESRGLRRLGSAAVDLAYVACGRFDGFYEYNLNPWDVAGGLVLIAEAGGQVTDFTGTTVPRSGHQVLASNRLIHDSFRAAIARHFS